MRQGLNTDGPSIDRKSSDRKGRDCQIVVAAEWALEDVDRISRAKVVHGTAIDMYRPKLACELVAKMFGSAVGWM